MNRFDGFHEFVVARGAALSRTAFLLTGEHHAAEDLVQSALAKAAARWRQIMEYGQPEAYVRRTMINEHISWWRRRPARPMAEVPDRPGADEPHHVVDRVVLGQALATLTPRQRAVVVLRYYEDLSEADTAAAMGCSIGTVKSQTHLAIGKLRSALPMFAEQARVYADAEAAVHRAQRSKARRVALGAALAVVPLALAAVLFVLRGGDTVPPPLTPSPSPTATGPAQLPPPLPTPVPAAGGTGTLRPLPRDRGVGPASLLRYEPGGIDLLAGGSWYRIDVPVVKPVLSGAPVELSPDGRWLMWTTRFGAIVRDLTGTAEHTLDGVEAVRWSPSANWLLAITRTRTYAVFSVPDFAQVAAPERRKEWSIAGVLDSGEVLRMGSTGEHGAIDIEVLDWRTGQVTGLGVDLSGVMKPGELVRRHIMPLAWIHPTAAGTAGIEVRLPPIGDHVGALVQFTVDTGQVVRRHEVPASTGSAGPNAPLCFRGTELIWRDGDGHVYTRAYPGAPDVALNLPSGNFRAPGCWPDL